jgi:glutaredoxin-like protein
LDKTTKEKLNRLFEKNLEEDVRLILFTQETECELCKETHELLQEISSISLKIKLEVYDFVKDTEKAKELGVDKIPAIVLNGRKDYKIHFYGIPSGYEFATLIDDIMDVSKGRSRLQSPVLEKVRSISKPVHIQVFVTPTCPYCPRAVRVAHQMALENTLITSDMIEATEFPHLVNRYSVMAVPKIVVNEKTEFVGAQPEENFVENILQAFERPSIS